MDVQTETGKVDGNTTATISLDLSAEEMVRVHQHLAKVFDRPEASLEELLILAVSQAFEQHGVKWSSILVTGGLEGE